MATFGTAPSQTSRESWFAGEISLDDFRKLHPNMGIFKSNLKAPKEVTLSNGEKQTVTQIFWLKERFTNAEGKPMAGVTLAKVSWSFDDSKPAKIVIQCYESVDEHTGAVTIKTQNILCNIGANGGEWVKDF